MKKLPRCLCIAVVVCAIMTLLLRHESDRDLGTQALPGTRFKIHVVQVRTVGNMLGLGSAQIWCGLVDEQGDWKLTQRLYVIGRQKALRADWKHPDSLQIKEENGMQMIEIPLQFSDGSTMMKKICLGLMLQT